MPYVKSVNGYMADVPVIWFKRCDGKTFYYDELTAASVTPNQSVTEINAGWSQFPVATIPGAGGLEMSFTSGKFDMSMFSMANAAEQEEDASFTAPEAEYLTVASGLTVTLAKQPIEGSVYIDGLTAGASAAAGVYTISEKTITFAEGDVAVGDQVLVTYETTNAASVVNIANKTSAIGEATLKWPVYSSGDDCTESGVKGHIVCKIFRCRATQAPGFDTSYKSAATNSVTFSAMDAKRSDGRSYAIAYIPAE